MRSQILILIVTLAVTACQKTTEVVEIRDENGKLVEKFQIRAADGEKHGWYKKLEDEKVILEENYQEGLLEGKRIFYGSNGKPIEEETYEKGLLVGEVISYYESGEVKAKQPYIIKNGESVLEGTFREYFKNGQLKTEATMKANETNGPFTEYHKNGNIKAKGTQVTHELLGRVDDGLLELFDENGELVKKMNCSLGRCETIE
jgi:antitoxin component YwqK of YwqJK toxin-antitoxin module